MSMSLKSAIRADFEHPAPASAAHTASPSGALQIGSPLEFYDCSLIFSPGKYRIALVLGDTFELCPLSHLRTTQREPHVVSCNEAIPSWLFEASYDRHWLGGACSKRSFWLLPGRRPH